MSSEKAEFDELFTVPIEPFPAIPACDASTISNKE